MQRIMVVGVEGAHPRLVEFIQGPQGHNGIIGRRVDQGAVVQGHDARNGVSETQACHSVLEVAALMGGIQKHGGFETLDGLRVLVLTHQANAFVEVKVKIIRVGFQSFVVVENSLVEILQFIVAVAQLSVDVGQRLTAGRVLQHFVEYLQGRLITLANFQCIGLLILGILVVGVAVWYLVVKCDGIIDFAIVGKLDGLADD